MFSQNGFKLEAVHIKRVLHVAEPKKIIVYCRMMLRLVKDPSFISVLDDSSYSAFAFPQKGFILSTLTEDMGDIVPEIVPCPSEGTV